MTDWDRKVRYLKVMTRLHDIGLHSQADVMFAVWFCKQKWVDLRHAGSELTHGYPRAAGTMVTETGRRIEFTSFPADWVQGLDYTSR